MFLVINRFQIKKKRKNNIFEPEIIPGTPLIEEISSDRGVHLWYLVPVVQGSAARRGREIVSTKRKSEHVRGLGCFHSLRYPLRTLAP